MIRQLGHGFAAFFKRVMPEPFVVAVGITIVTGALAAVLDRLGPLEVARAWLGTRERGLWSLLAFSMQMVLILVTGHALAAAPPVARLVRRLASLPRSAPQAAALVALVAVLSGLVHWGLGLILGALSAREVGRAACERGLGVHYPLLCAAGYTGMMTWHGGLSGSAPLKVTTRADLIELLGPELGGRLAPIAFTDTVLGGENFLVTGGLVVIVPLTVALLSPRRSEEQDPPPEELGEPLEPAPGASSVARSRPFSERLEQSPLVAVGTVLVLGAGLAVWWIDTGLAGLDPNALNLAFLTLGIALHGNLRGYLRAATDAASGTTGIVLQFPLYAGVLALVSNTSLGARIAGLVGDLANPSSFAVWTFLASGLMNLFVPSGGGQWALQGPIALRAASELGVEPRLAVLAVAYGDQLTNMLQPFWALPLLAITRVRARDVVGYTTLVMLVGDVWIAAALYALSP